MNQSEGLVPNVTTLFAKMLSYGLAHSASQKELLDISSKVLRKFEDLTDALRSNVSYEYIESTPPKLMLFFL